VDKERRKKRKKKKEKKEKNYKSHLLDTKYEIITSIKEKHSFTTQFVKYL
jgi:hypothetical protein